MNYSITKNNITLDKNLYYYNEIEKLLICNEDNVSLKAPDFFTVIVRSNCSIILGNYCVLKCADLCKIKSLQNCVLIRKDVFEILDISNKNIQTNKYAETCYKNI